MSVSTDGQLCFGSMFDEGYEFPWDEDRFGGEIEYWWLEELGWKPPVEVYDEGGRRIDGVEDSDIAKYYGDRRAILKANPLPVQPVNYCSGECPMYILAVPSTCLSAYRGYPKSLSPGEFTVDDADLESFNIFCRNYDLLEGPTTWWLSSYTG